MSRRDCTAPLSCRLPQPLSLSHVELVPVDRPRSVADTRAVYSARVNGEHVGTVRDAGFRTHDGRWYFRWEAFAGGSAVPTGIDWRTGEDADRDLGATFRALVDYVSRAAFHGRMALHG